MNDNLSLYNVFITVAESGSILSASEKLYISQPAVSKSIKKLEENLGMSLFIRSTKGVRLTDSGLILYDRIKNAFEYIIEGENILRGRLELGMGSFSIGVSSTLCKYILLPYLSEYTKLNPHVSISIECRSSGETATGLLKNRIDLGLIALPSDNTLKSLSLGYIHDIFVATPKYLENMHQIQSASGNYASDINLLMLNKENLTRQHVDSYLPKGFLEQYNLMEADNMDLLIEFAKAGVGIGCVIKEFVSGELNRKILMQCNLGLPQIEKREVCFAYSVSRMPNPHVLDFIDFVASKKDNVRYNILIS